MSYVIRASSIISNCLYFRVYSWIQHTESRALKADETDVDGMELTSQLNTVLTLPMSSVILSSTKEIWSSVKRKTSKLLPIHTACGSQFRIDFCRCQIKSASVKWKLEMNTTVQGWGIKPICPNLYSFLQLNLSCLSASFLEPSWFQWGNAPGSPSWHVAAQQLEQPSPSFYFFAGQQW